MGLPRSQSFRRVAALALLLGLALAFAVPVARPVYAAASIQVDPTANDANDTNDGKCSLWEALQAIGQGSTYNNCTLSGSAPYSITFKSSGTLKVINGNLPFVTKNVAITGPVIIEGNGNDNIFVVHGSGILSLANLTMRKGNPAILNLSSNAVVNIAGCSFIDNKNDGDGGAISSAGKLNIAGSVFSGNSSDGSDGGGAIWAIGTEALAVAGTVFNGNIAKRSGGAIFATAPAVLTDVVFNGNIANGIDPNNNGTDDDPADEYDSQGGGALFSRNDSANGRKLTITRGVFNGNLTPQGHGGAIYNNSGSTVEIQDSAFNGNLAGKPPTTDRHGGAIVNFGGKLSVTRTTLLNNAAQGDGGGIANDRDGDMTLSNISMTANAATGRGGAIFSFNTQQGSTLRPSTTALNVTLSLNAAADEGGGIYAQEPTPNQPDVVVLGNTIIANSDGPGLGGNCAGGQAISQGHNLDSGASCGLNQAGDLSNADPKLNAPGFNGGPIPELLSQKLGPGSDAADAGDADICAAAPVSNQDIRGDARPKGPRCDIGAFEAEAPVAGFGSQPVQPGPIDFGNVTFGANQTAGISVFNTGDKTLELTNPQIGGANAADFALLTGFPLDVDAPTAINLRCAPTGATAGPRAATFSFSTNDPDTPSVSYNLECNAVPQPVAGFGSTPAAPGPIDFGNVLLGQSKNSTITVKEIGTATLTVNNPVMGGANPGDFSTGGISLSLTDGHAPVAVSVSCAPTAPGVRSATLTVSTNDPTQPAATFNLICAGKIPPTPPLALPAASVPNATTNAALGPYGLAVSPDGKHVYAADDGDHLVSAFAYDAAAGSLTFLDEYDDEFSGGPDLQGARIVLASPDGRNVYVASHLDDAITAFARNPDTGALTILDSVKQGDGYGCFPAPCDGNVSGLDGAYGIALSPDGRYVYVSSISDGAIVVLRRAADGGLHTGAPLPIGANFAQTITHPDLVGAYGIALSPDGAHLYATGYSSDKLVAFKRNLNDGKLTYVETKSAATIAGLNGVFRATVSPDGNHVYTASYDSDSVTAFQRNPADGKLTHIGTYTDGANGIDGLASASSVALSPDGKYLFATAYADHAVAVFERDAATGLLTFAQVVKRDAGGQPPLQGARDVAVAPDGRAIFATGRLDSRVVALRFANPKPTLDSLAPASATATNGAITLVVNSADFVRGGKVRWNNGLDLTTTFVNSSQLKASVGVGLLSNAGARPVSVINPAPGGGTSNALSFTITQPAQNPIPSIDELNPAGAAAGGPPLTLTVKGANFQPGSKVRWNGADRPTTYVSATTLQAQIEAADVAQPGDAAVTVLNPTPGGGASNAAAFGVAAPGENPAPAITALSPAFVTAGANGALALTILGSNFLPESQAQWNGEDRPTTFVSGGELRMEISGADLIAPGTGSVQVFNPAPGGGPSNVVGFTIGAAGSNPVPALARVSAVAINPGGTLTLTLDGGGFIPATQARWNGANRTTAYVGPTRVRMTIAASDFAGGSAVITASNPGPGGGGSNELLYVIAKVYAPLGRK